MMDKCNHNTMYGDKCLSCNKCTQEIEKDIEEKKEVEQ